MFGEADINAILTEIKVCRKALANHARPLNFANVA